MNGKFLIGSIAALALGTAGSAVADSPTTSGEKQYKEKQHQEQKGQTSEIGESEGVERERERQVTREWEKETTGEQAGKERTTQKAGVERLDSVDLKNLDDEAAQNLQTKLQELGYYQADIDGKIGPKTRAALTRYFQDQVQLVQRGRLSEDAMTALGFEESEIERVRGVGEGQDIERQRGVDEEGMQKRQQFEQEQEQEIERQRGTEPSQRLPSVPEEPEPTPPVERESEQY
jgi:hypothetical protein